MTRGVNKSSKFTRTGPGDAVVLIPSQATDGQAGFDVRTRDRAGIVFVNDTDQAITYRLLGYHHLDNALTDPVELVAAFAVAAGATARKTISVEGLGWLQVEQDAPAGPTTGDATVVFGSDVDG